MEGYNQSMNHKSVRELATIDVSVKRGELMILQLAINLFWRLNRINLSIVSLGRGDVVDQQKGQTCTSKSCLVETK